MKVQSQRNWPDARDDRPGEVRHLLRHRNADGIAERHLLCPCLGHPLRQFDHPRRRHFAIIGATERRRDRHLREQPGGAGFFEHQRVDRYAFGNGLALVGDAEAIARHQHAAGLIQPAPATIAAGNRPVHPALVEAQPDEAHAGGVGQPGHHRFGIRHLRHPARVDEARDFNPRRAHGDQPRNQRQLVGGFDKTLLVLQAIARRHFDDLDGIGHGESIAKAAAKRQI